MTGYGTKVSVLTTCSHSLSLDYKLDIDLDLKRKVRDNKIPYQLRGG